MVEHRSGPTAEMMLPLMSFGPDSIVHPVELLTIDAAAHAAQIPKSSAMSALGSTERFRSLVLAEIVRTLRVRPSTTTWRALRRGRNRTELVASVADLLEGRRAELAADPALPLFFSAFDHLDDPRVVAAVTEMLDQFVDTFWPFVVAVGAASVTPFVDPLSPARRFIVGHFLLAEAYRALLGVGVDDLDRGLVEISALVIAMGPEVKERETTSSGPTSCECPSRPDPRSRAEVVRAGARLLLDKRVPLTTEISLAEVTRCAGVCEASFYRRFESKSPPDGRRIRARDRMRRPDQCAPLRVDVDVGSSIASRSTLPEC